MTKQDPSLTSKNGLGPLQQQLFPLDPWGCDGVFSVVDGPHPTIARAMVGPLFLGQDIYADSQKIRCIALHNNRQFLFSTEIASELLLHPDEFWDSVASQLNVACSCPADDQSAPLRMTPMDSVQRWSNRAFWMPETDNAPAFHPAEHALSKLMELQDIACKLGEETVHPLHYEYLAQAQVNVQLETSMQSLLLAMVPQLCAAYTQRTRLSTGMVNQLLALAHAHGALATQYILQAIQTESFGLLHLMTFDNGSSDAQEIRQVVFSGQSLPSKFNDLGVPKGVHRRTLFSPTWRVPKKQVQPLDISSLHLPGDQWLSAMRLTQKYPIYSLDEWQTLGQMLGQLQLLNLSDKALACSVMECCVKDSYRQCGVVLNRLCSNARALLQGAQRFALISLSLEECLSTALKWETHPPTVPDGLCSTRDIHDEKNPAVFIWAVCQALGLNVYELMQSTLNTHPGVPTGFFSPDGLLLVPLDSIAMIYAHGNHVGNCLNNFTSVVRYMANGAALYGVLSEGLAVGTIALKRDTDEPDLRVEVLEISGRSNEPSHYELGQLAQTLASKWNASSEIETWSRFTIQSRFLSPDYLTLSPLHNFKPGIPAVS